MFYEVYIFFFRYSVPINLSLLWNYGVVAIVFLFIQLLTGVFISMNYLANSDLAFWSVENIMRNVNYGWLLRYVHANGASFFFFSVYIHVLRNLRFNSYLPPRREVWILGVMILLVMILTAFTGYVLPWGQMSFWAATVITNLASAVPVIGDFIVVWLWGGFSVSTITLNRFFTFHFLLPFIILALVFLHLLFLHSVGSSNRILARYSFDKTQFQIFFTLKDAYFINYILIFFVVVIGFYPNILGHPDNYIPANALVTPAHIVPEWYFLLYYAMLRSIPSKIGGVVILLSSIIILFIFPFFISFSKYTTNKLFSIWYEGSYWKELLRFEKKIIEILTSNNKKLLFFLFCFFTMVCIILFLIGGKPIERPFLEVGRWSTFLYFIYFFLIIKLFNNLQIKKATKNLFHECIMQYYAYKLHIYNLVRYKSAINEEIDFDAISIYYGGEREPMWYLVYLRSLSFGADIDKEAGIDSTWY